MRIRLSIVSAALVLASATSATAQTTPSAPAPSQGTIELGGLFGSTDGDEARYERYRDTRNGVFSDIRFTKDTDKYLFELKGYHIGYRDQSMRLGYDNGRLRFSAMWDSLPLNYMYGAITPWVTNGNTLTLNDDAQRDVQNRVASGIPCAFVTTCTNLTTAGAALARRSIYNNVASSFDMQAKRETGGAELAFAVTKDADVHVAFTTTRKSGTMPWAGSFAFNNANEFAAPIDNRTNDLSAGIEWANAKGMIRLGWDASFFNNDVESIVWDNPLRLTDFTNGTAIPWDASGYSNGNGPAQGRMALWPSNSQNVVSATALYKIARATSVNGTVQFTKQDQDADLIPWTINNVINNAISATNFPHLRGLPRGTAEAGVNGLNALLNFTSRPNRYLGIQARYRYNKRDVTTPEFDATEYVRFDAVPEEIEHGTSHQYDTTRQTFDVNATFNTNGFGAFKVGYGHDAWERHGRGFSEVGENTLRASYDVTNLQYVSVRAGFDVSRRRGEGFVLAGTDYEIQDAGEQPGLRYYDEADRDRTRGSLVLTVMPVDIMSVYVQFAAGKDEFLGDESIPVGREQFGLLDASFKNWNIGTTISAGEKVQFGANFGREDFSALQKSRNANPPPDATWTDPNRNWTLDNDEEVRNFNVFVDLFKAIEKTDIRLAYDYSDSDNSFLHGGPRITSLTAAGTFLALPNVTNTWKRLSADVKYFFTKAVGVGVGYYYEKLDVSDFATIDANGSVGFTAATGTPRLEYLGELMTGYAARPYSGSNGFVRLIYMF